MNRKRGSGRISTDELRCRGMRASRRVVSMSGVVSFMVVCSLTVGCAMVKVEPEAESVAVVKTAEEVGACRKLSEIGVNTVPKILLIPRNETTVALELERLARNEAARSGGNTIVPMGPVSEKGQRKYSNYQCER